MFHELLVMKALTLPCSGTLRVWELNPKIRKVLPTDCNLGQLKRVVKCIKISDEDEFMYCGTTSGDVLQVCTSNAGYAPKR